MSATSISDKIPHSHLETHSEHAHRMQEHEINLNLAEKRKLTPQQIEEHQRGLRYHVNALYQLSQRDNDLDTASKLEKYYPTLIGNPFSELSDGSDRVQKTAD